MSKILKQRTGLLAGIFTAAAASVCCITPVLALIGGVGSMASSFAWIQPYRPYLIGLTIAVFSFAWYQKLRPQKTADCCEVNSKKSFMLSTRFLLMVTIVAAALLAFPYFSGIFYKTKSPAPGNVAVAATNNISTVQLSISGMDCEGCTAPINNELRQIKGVINANTFYQNGNAIVKFNTTQTAVDSLANVINSMGYKVTSSTIINK